MIDREIFPAEEMTDISISPKDYKLLRIFTESFNIVISWNKKSELWMIFLDYGSFSFPEISMYNPDKDPKVDYQVIIDHVFDESIRTITHYQDYRRRKGLL